MGKQKYKKGPTKEEKEAASKRKKFESKWINKNCFDQSPLKLSRGDLSLKQLRFGTIQSHELESVSIGLDTIKLNSSWTEFILIMLSQLIEEHPDDFKDILGKNCIANQSFYVEKVYGNYSFERQGYQVYKIFDTDYYLEAQLNSRVIFNAIAHLIRTLEIDPASIRFRVVSKDMVDRPEEKVIVSLNYNTDTCTIDELQQRLDNNEHLAYIKIFDEVTEVHRLDVALLAFCNMLYDKYGMTKILTVPNDEQTGVCINELSTDYPCARIRNSLVLVYTSGSTSSIVNFMSNAIDELEIDEQNIVFGFKSTEVVKHEWEVD